MINKFRKGIKPEHSTEMKLRKNVPIWHNITLYNRNRKITTVIKEKQHILKLKNLIEKEALNK